MRFYVFQVTLRRIHYLPHSDAVYEPVSDAECLMTNSMPQNGMNIFEQLRDSMVSPRVEFY